MKTLYNFIENNLDLFTRPSDYSTWANDPWEAKEETINKFYTKINGIWNHVIVVIYKDDTFSYTCESKNSLPIGAVILYEGSFKEKDDSTTFGYHLFNKSYAQAVKELYSELKITNF